MREVKRLSRRQWLRRVGEMTVAGCGIAAIPASIRKALAVEPKTVSGTLQDVQHVVLLMQENRSFDHYFGTMSGVRGFGDRSLVPQPHGGSAFAQFDGSEYIAPFHLDTQATQAMRVPGTPHSWSDSQLAWDQGRMSEWARWKLFQSMGYYEVDDIPYQRALADAFTLCDAHHCSIQSGTFANRLVYMTGTNFTPGMTEPASAQNQAAINNRNNLGIEFGAYTWTTYPERLQAAGVSWRIYQEEDWDGLLAPWRAFERYQRARRGDPLHDNALNRWTLEHLAAHVSDGTLPQVSWILPPRVWSEHPAESSPLQGAAYIRRILDILTANPDVWSRTVFLVAFDENDGFFDHVPPPAPPSINNDGTVRGGSTLSDSQMGGLYFRNEISGTTATRPYGLGPRVPLYVISPWSRGGWVCSQVFDHTSTIRFLEARFGVEEPNISAWHRAISGDLTQCFDFTRPTFISLPALPDVSTATGDRLSVDHLPPVTLPGVNRLPRQDHGVRPSRSLTYQIAVDAAADLEAQSLELTLDNTGASGAVLHVYDKNHLHRVPHRYTIEAGKRFSTSWGTADDDGEYDLVILGPNGSRWLIAGRVPPPRGAIAQPEVYVRAAPAQQAVELTAVNFGELDCILEVAPTVYSSDPSTTLELTAASGSKTISWPVNGSGFWYDFKVTTPSLPRWLRRFAGRVETGRHSITDPSLGSSARRC